MLAARSSLLGGPGVKVLVACGAGSARAASAGSESSVSGEGLTEWRLEAAGQAAWPGASVCAIPGWVRMWG